MTERARIEYVIDKTGLSWRTIQAMASRGEIPGAAKLGKSAIVKFSAARKASA